MSKTWTQSHPNRILPLHRRDKNYNEYDICINGENAWIFNSWRWAKLGTQSQPNRIVVVLTEIWKLKTGDRQSIYQSAIGDHASFIIERTVFVWMTSVVSACVSAFGKNNYVILSFSFHERQSITASSIMHAPITQMHKSQWRETTTFIFTR